MDGLEKRLQEEKSSDTPVTDIAVSATTAIKGKQEDPSGVGDRRNTIASFQGSVSANKINHNNEESHNDRTRRGSLGFLPSYNNSNNNNNNIHAQSGFRQQQNITLPDAILDTFFSRIHGRPFYILEESNTRQKHQLGQLPSHLILAIYALTVR